MSLLGKILAVLNVLAAALFVYLAAADWGKRQAWTYAIYRYDLTIDGLPIDENDRDAEGGLLVSRLSDKTLQDMFQKVGGGIPGSGISAADKTQVAEVKRVHDRLRSNIETAGNDAAKRQKLVNVLVPLARTEGEWMGTYKQIVNSKPDDLMAPTGLFEHSFSDALAEQGPDGKPRAHHDRKKAIAHLLFNLESAPEWYERVQVVVGTKAFTEVANLQGSALKSMSEQVQELADEDLRAFEKEHRRIIGELQIAAENVKDRKTELAKQTRLVEEHEILVNARKTEIQELKTKVELSRQSAQKALLALAKVQDRLFGAQQRVGSKTAANQQLEREIRTLETSER